MTIHQSPTTRNNASYGMNRSQPITPLPFGLRRSLDAPGVLAQLARRLDATPKALENEIAVSLDALNIDSASFRQLREAEKSSSGSISDQIFSIVAERGKMQNPVTGSGGIFLGNVKEVGPRHPDAGTLAARTRIVSLVSLTLTPLQLTRVIRVRPETERVDVEGTAILFARTIYGRLPTDL